MKKTLFVITVLAVGLAAFGIAGSAYAKNASPMNPEIGMVNQANGNGHGGTMGDGTGIPMEQNINLDGLLDETMSSNIAEALGITVDELKAREAAGETLVDIGLSLGFDIDTILSIRVDARTDALTQAVADGLITQEQADWLLSRINTEMFGENSGDPLKDNAQEQVRQGFGKGFNGNQ